MNLNLWPPCLILYTDDLPAGVGGEAGFLSVKIRPKYEHDVGLHQHEFTHIWQGIIIWPHPLLYRWYRWYRQWAEVMAYRVQMRYPNWDGDELSLDDAAWRLVNSGYDIGLTLSEARTLLNV